MLEYSKCCLRCVLRCTALHAPDENMRHHRSWFSSIGVRIQEQETLQASYHLSQSGCELVDGMLSISNRTELVRYRRYKIGGLHYIFLTITGGEAVRKGVQPPFMCRSSLLLEPITNTYIFMTLYLKCGDRQSLVSFPPCKPIKMISEEGLSPVLSARIRMFSEIFRAEKRMRTAGAGPRSKYNFHA